ncbi:hypothetical protein ABER23_06950 [Paenibacillus lautus]|uniref:hypothetical protein n=1 Tax=Paenibacillus lautus TaxID=1401 RepID=UPI003D2BE75A
MATRVSYPVEVKRKAIEMKLTGIPVSEVNSNDCSGVDGVHTRGSQCNPSKSWTGLPRATYYRWKDAYGSKYKSHGREDS